MVVHHDRRIQFCPVDKASTQRSVYLKPLDTFLFFILTILSPTLAGLSSSAKEKKRSFSKGEQRAK
mgnify:CR=1 FL=1